MDCHQNSGCAAQLAANPGFSYEAIRCWANTNSRQARWHLALTAHGFLRGNRSRGCRQDYSCSTSDRHLSQYSLSCTRVTLLCHCDCCELGRCKHCLLHFIIEALRENLSRRTKSLPRATLIVHRLVSSPHPNSRLLAE
jgi:hypothetical protein